MIVIVAAARQEAGMTEIGTWILVWLVAVILNAIPVFMPPTWSLLAYFHLREGLPVLPLAISGALAAMTGRTLLALASRRFGMRFLSEQRKASIQSLADTLMERKGFSLSLLRIFAIGPIPTNHLFIAAGLARIPLPPVVLVFGVTRFVSYLLWVKAAETAASSLRDVIAPSLGSGFAAAAQVIGFIALILLMRLDWTRLLRRLGGQHPDSGMNPA
jgi:membrane protein YqaA with SNARE-associated domain